MRIAIVDDMERDRIGLHDMTAHYLKARGTQAELQLFSSGEEFLSSYARGRFSILLLDLFMGGVDGMTVARRVREEGDGCQIVFITSSDAYAVSSYEVEAANYLLKPVDEEALDRALARCLNRLGTVPQYIEVMANRLPTRVPLHGILWISTYQNAVLLHTDGGVVKTYMTFERLNALLEGERRFLMCYKGCLVNMDRVAAIEGDDFRMASGERVQIRKRGGNQIKQAYIQYLCDRASDRP